MDDKNFPNELRSTLRYVTASAVKKILEIDFGALIASKLIPCVIKHVDDYHHIQQLAKLREVNNINKITVEYLGRKLHIAAANRNNELKYLRELTNYLLPHLLPEDCLLCR